MPGSNTRSPAQTWTRHPGQSRIAAYAASALVFAWIPILGAFAFTYALMVLMGIGIQSAYKTSFITTVVTVLVGFVPVASILVWIAINEVAL